MAVPLWEAQSSASAKVYGVTTMASAMVVSASLPCGVLKETSGASYTESGEDDIVAFLGGCCIRKLR